MRTNPLSAELRGKREETLNETLSTEDDARHSFRDEIVSSWRRCQAVGVAPTGDEVPYQPEFERPEKLLRAASPVIDRLADQLVDGPFSILLADSEAQIVDRRAGVRKLTTALDNAGVAPGFHYAEEFTGTNGIGSALEERKPFQVSGSEHFRENLQEFTCTGAPLRHPISGAVEGVLDVTSRVHDNPELMQPLVLAAVREIESRLYADASRREQLLLQHFLQVSKRATAVITLNEDVVMANTAASSLLDVSDQAMLWEWACQVLGTRHEYTGDVRLSHDTVVQAKATKVGDEAGGAGVLVEMRQQHSATSGAPITWPQQTHRTRSHATELPGRSVAGQRLRDDVEVALRTQGPVLICGEPGVGKLYTATHLHRRREQRQSVTVLDALAAYDDHAAWISRLDSSVASGVTVVLRHLDQLPSDLAPRVEGILDAAPTVIATARSRGSQTAASRTLDHFPVSITVPPLRYRSEDITDIAPLLLSAHTTNRPPRLRPATLRTLTKLDWPGNIRELESVLATAITRSLGSDICLEHLPTEYRSTDNRAGASSLQRAERDIVLEALSETQGNKLAAAKRLGIARSTLYRKMRILGIDQNRLPPPQHTKSAGPTD